MNGPAWKKCTTRTVRQLRNYTTKIMSTTKIERARELAKRARISHHGVYLTGPNQVQVLEDELPSESLNGQNFLLASFGNCRCASDAKAIRQFDTHATGALRYRSYRSGARDFANCLGSARRCECKAGRCGGRNPRACY